MAVARCEMSPNEYEAVLEILRPHKADSHELKHAVREMERALKAGRESEQRDRENMARIRRNRRVPGFDETPLIPDGVSRRSERVGGKR